MRAQYPRPGRRKSGDLPGLRPDATHIGGTHTQTRRPVGYLAAMEILERQVQIDELVRLLREAAKAPAKSRSFAVKPVREKAPWWSSSLSARPVRLPSIGVTVMPCRPPAYSDR